MWHDARALNRLASSLLVFAVLLFIGTALAWAARRPVFAITAIRVEGADGLLRHVSVPALRAAIAGRLHGTFFTADLNAWRDVFETVPWVRRASVRRLWPNRLVLRVEEHRPFALWGDGRLLNTRGELFTANLGEAEAEGELPRLNGPPGTEADVFEHYALFASAFAPLAFQPRQVVLSPRYAWQLTLAHGLKVELGRETSDQALRERIGRFVQALPQVESRLGRSVVQADLRYANGFAIRAPGGVPRIGEPG